MENGSLDDFDDDVLLTILYHASPSSQLGGCSRRLAHLSRTPALWQAWCEARGLPLEPSREKLSYMDMYIRAFQCNHERGSQRKLRWQSAGQPPTHDAELFAATEKFPPMRTACECQKCGAIYSVVVSPHLDDQAQGLRMCQVDFSSPSEGWSEVWYMIKDLYSLRGSPGHSLKDAVTRVELEGKPSQLFAGLVCEPVACED